MYQIKTPANSVWRVPKLILKDQHHTALNNYIYKYSVPFGRLRLAKKNS